MAARTRSTCCRDADRVGYVKLSAQPDDHAATAFADTQIHVEHGSARLLQQQGRVLT
jgi:hypothetical protein